jgi:hypothetical protein
VPEADKAHALSVLLERWPFRRDGLLLEDPCAAIVHRIASEFPKMALHSESSVDGTDRTREDPPG